MLADDSTQNIIKAADQLIEIDDRRLNGLLAGYGQELPRELRPALSDIVNFIEIMSGFGDAQRVL